MLNPCLSYVASGKRREKSRIKTLRFSLLKHTGYFSSVAEVSSENLNAKNGTSGDPLQRGPTATTDRFQRS